MKNLLKALLLLLLPLFSFSQEPFSVYLIGDAGEDTVPGKALQLLRSQLISSDNSAVVFLGDNVYPSGFSLKDTNSILHLESQLQILKEYKGRAYFIPGNHDWNAQRRNGLKKVDAEAEFVESYLAKNTHVVNKDGSSFLPADGLPGPSSVLLTDKLRIIFIDTQWFLHSHKKNAIISKKNTAERFYTKLDSLLLLSKNNNEQVIIAAHHPMYTNGEHSRKLQPIRFLINYTPFHIFGITGLSRLLSQDIIQPRYAAMQKKMLSIINGYDNIIYVSGHDHNLQCFKEGGNKYIVSGCGSKLSRLKRKKSILPLFEDDSKTGFVKLEFYPEKKVNVIIFRTGEKELLLNNY